MNRDIDLVIVGGGAAGMSAAISAYDDKLNILVIESGPVLGGILNQCIHNGFGLHVFNEELTGPEYAHRYEHMFREKKIQYLLNTTVLDIEKSDDFKIIASSREKGLFDITCKAVILASGCYERTRGAISLPGDRPKGILPAGSAQRYLNMEGYLVGERIFILGSGDIGLIMARRMTLEGCQVLGVAEIMPYSNGLTRNIVQCLHDFDIPLYLSHTISNIEGKERLEAITIQEVDRFFNPKAGTEKRFEVDTLLLSVGLIPDIALFDSLKIKLDKITRSAVVNQYLESNIEGLFVCGNALHVHDLVDYVSIESEKAGTFAKRFLLSKDFLDRYEKEMVIGEGIRYVVPQMIDFKNFNEPIELSFRTTMKTERGLFKLKQNQKIIKTKKAKYITPSEMEKMVLSR
ncbi:MAG: FAD-dependent oxidoreductase, partial [Acholeplasmataceae bacterium]|nr:FAD-dependent oxidoreductase [Acholeplasmataceae bacterium]